MSDLRELFVSGITPIVVILVTLVYKTISLPDPPTHDEADEDEDAKAYRIRLHAARSEVPLAVIELLATAFSVVVIVAATTSDSRHRYVSIGAIVVLVVFMPLIAQNLKQRRRKTGCRLSRRDLWTYNGLGFIVLFASYFVSH